MWLDDVQTSSPSASAPCLALGRWPLVRLYGVISSTRGRRAARAPRVSQSATSCTLMHGAPRLWSGVGRGSEVHGRERFLSRRRRNWAPHPEGSCAVGKWTEGEARTYARISRDQRQQAVEDSRLDCLLIRDAPLVDVGRIRNVGRGSAWTLSHRLAVGSGERAFRRPGEYRRRSDHLLVRSIGRRGRWFSHHLRGGRNEQQRCPD